MFDLLVSEVDVTIKFYEGNVVVQIALIVSWMDQNWSDIFFDVMVNFIFPIDVPVT